jgi:hypothetical protein
MGKSGSLTGNDDKELISFSVRFNHRFVLIDPAHSAMRSNSCLLLQR